LPTIAAQRIRQGFASECDVTAIAVRRHPQLQLFLQRPIEIGQRCPAHVVDEAIGHAMSRDDQEAEAGAGAVYLTRHGFPVPCTAFCERRDVNDRDAVHFAYSAADQSSNNPKRLGLRAASTDR
jgi:hypothetical protein